MIKKRFIALAIVIQSLLSNFCLMPLVSAMEAMPMDHDEMQEMEQVTELVMTPANAISPLDCDNGCITVMRPRHHVDMGSMRVPCNDGHCLTEHTETAAIMTQSPQRETTTVATLPVSAVFIESTQKNELLQSGADTSFMQNSLTKTIVLRQ